MMWQNYLVEKEKKTRVKYGRNIFLRISKKLLKSFCALINHVRCFCCFCTQSCFFPLVHILDLDKLNLVELVYSGLVLGSSPFLLLPKVSQKMILASKVVKIDLKIIILPYKSKSMTQTV